MVKHYSILSIHNRYRIRGGEEESYESEKLLLKSMGHEVNTFEEDNDRLAKFNSAQLALRTIWSQESYKTVRHKLKHHNSDLIHVQNFFPLISPSVYYAAQSLGRPVVQTLRNYRLICPNGLFFRQGNVCEDCIGKFIPYPGVIHSCYRNNLGATISTVAMLSFHRMLKTWTNQVNIFIALSEFARQKFIISGIPENKIITKPNFVYPDPGQGTGSGGYALYVGRLSTEKGLDTLLAAWEQLSIKMPLKIIGEGPLEQQVAEATKQIPHIEWLGRRSISDVYKIMGEAAFLVFPSKWYETFGRVAIESFAKGTPVIASKLGAITELIDHKVNGLYFNPGDARDLAEKIEWCLEFPNLLKEMRHASRSEYIQKYTAQKNYNQLLDIYTRACG